MSTIFTSNLSQIIITGCLAASLTACAVPEKPAGHIITETHRIQVTSEQVSIAIALPQRGETLAPGDASRFNRFLRDYVQRGRTAVTVESAQPTVARAVLLNHGLRDNEIFIAPDATIKAPNALLSFTANKAVAPECGDWSGSPTSPMGNAPHTNHGCSVQRNTAKMVSDPGDFIQAQPAAGDNASRTDAGILLHQSGEKKERLLDGQGSTVTTQ